MKGYVCGVDLGGTKINTGIMDSNGRIIENIKLPTKAEEGPDAVIERILESIGFVLEKSGIGLKDIRGIGVGSPGPIDAERGIVVKSANLPGWNNVPVVERIKERFPTQVRINNDANAAALGEYKFGSGRGTRNFVYVTVSTGIGGGAIIDGKLYNGANLNAAEIGHTIINFDGPRCNCGSFGCFEAYASGTAIARIACEEIQGGKNTLISSIAGEKPVKAEDVFEAGRKGDELALQIIDREGFYLGIGIANILGFYNPERIAFGGGVSSQLDMFYDKMIETAKSRSLGPSFDACSIVRSELGGDIGLLGAAALVE